MSREDWGSAVVGLGGISHSHLEGYRRQGLRVIGGADPSAERRELAREKFGLDLVTEDPGELIARPDVKVVDLTVPHMLEVRRPLVEAAARHGKAVFIQKPLMPSLAEARLLVEIAAGAGVPMMVNQNSVFSPQALLISENLDAIGAPYFFQAGTPGSASPSGGSTATWRFTTTPSSATGSGMRNPSPPTSPAIRASGG
jgi:scyllo-inositol 2-dehydrogenase (NAD+)